MAQECIRLHRCMHNQHIVHTKMSIAYDSATYSVPRVDMAVHDGSRQAYCSQPGYFLYNIPTVLTWGLPQLDSHLPEVVNKFALQPLSGNGLVAAVKNC